METNQVPGVSRPQRRTISAPDAQPGTTTTDTDLQPSVESRSAAPGAGMTHEPRPSMARWARQSIVADLTRRYGAAAVDRHWRRLEGALDAVLGPIRVDWRQFGCAA